MIKKTLQWVIQKKQLAIQRLIKRQINKQKSLVKMYKI